MKYVILIVYFFICSSSVFSQAALKVSLLSKPKQHSNDTLYIVGNFNGWNPGLTAYSFQKDAAGNESVELKNIPRGAIEYKITRGNWSKVECAGDGTPVSNRILKLSNDTSITLQVTAWADDFPSRPPVSTKSKHVFIVDTSFNIPQLSRKRRIWIYLPEAYALSNKRFSVIYMHDGQNLFDVLTAPFGEWGADEMMDSVREAKQSIIVGIDHGGNTRLNEYNPYNSKFGKGEGDAYVEFIVKTLKPYIDSVYKTKPSRENTMIAGSSMGGLISLYAALKYPQVFGGAGIFSPAFWIAPQLKDFIKQQSASSPHPALYFICGEKESENMLSDMTDIYKLVRQAGNTNTYFKTIVAGQHNEKFWQQQLYDCYMWLKKNQTR
ncbi:MAG: alpha/beta hydrolase [Chitinophagaceae bacterium]|nr:alpha/beta hydrolase [Chitinophagaceae bacterium]